MDTDPRWRAAWDWYERGYLQDLKGLAPKIRRAFPPACAYCFREAYEGRAARLWPKPPYKAYMRTTDCAWPLAPTDPCG